MLWFGQKNSTKKGTRRSNLRTPTRRKPFLTKVIWWFRRVGIYVSSFVLIAWVGAWVTLSGTLDRWKQTAYESLIQASVDHGLSIQNLMVDGRNYVDADVLMALLNTEQGDPILAFNPDEARHNIERLSWVDKAFVQRKLPDTVYINIHEKVPVALWKEKETLKIIDQNGGLIADRNLERFKDFIIVLGNHAPEHTPDLVEKLTSEEMLWLKVESAEWVGNRRWDVSLKNGVVLKLPELDASYAIRRLVDAHKSDALLDKDIKMIDLRQSDRMIVRTTPGAVEEYKASLNGAGKEI